ncbi:MAG TPA: sulfotransferase domain-containing protein [Kiritimatiellia bacterium]|nr:sulfotransferase domain-containing protein [Kiritimatiellia bacterium]
MITVVSGLPRSGTSLMMQMLSVGGVPILADAHRPADANNPKGYLEFEKVKQLKRDDSWLGEAEGKAVKIISHLLLELPTDLQYQVVFMVRNLDEVVASQSAMLERLGRQGAPVTTVELKRVFSKHLEDVKVWLAKHDGFRTLYVNHHELVSQPQVEAERVSEFLGGGLHVEAMVGCVDPNLYRERSSV